MVYVEKHVEFTDEVQDDEENHSKDHQQRLHRRDTPHHLKNKRILSKNNDSTALEVTERELILDQTNFLVFPLEYDFP